MLVKLFSQTQNFNALKQLLQLKALMRRLHCPLAIMQCCHYATL